MSFGDNFTTNVEAAAAIAAYGDDGSIPGVAEWPGVTAEQADEFNDRNAEASRVNAAHRAAIHAECPWLERALRKPGP